jgi:hypothetical protein
MARDKAERRHRRTARHLEAIAMVANADFSGESLSEAMGLEKPMPSNGVAWIGDNLIVKNDRGTFDIWAKGAGWWSFGLHSEESARRHAELYQPKGA